MYNHCIGYAILRRVHRFATKGREPKRQRNRRNNPNEFRGTQSYQLRFEEELDDRNETSVSALEAHSDEANPRPVSMITFRKRTHDATIIRIDQNPKPGHLRICLRIL